jgi:hypothetical protein
MEFRTQTDQGHKNSAVALLSLGRELVSRHSNKYLCVELVKSFVELLWVQLNGGSPYFNLRPPMHGRI